MQVLQSWTVTVTVGSVDVEQDVWGFELVTGDRRWMSSLRGIGRTYHRDCCCVLARGWRAKDTGVARKIRG